ncbi:hypothetical protein II906_01950 [bacterium]|nr:hypothetical protein [bacterium]
MADENKNIEEVQANEPKPCFLCKKLGESEYLKKFITITLGSFAGVYLALSLFAYVHKPPVYEHKMPPMHHQYVHKQFHKECIHDFNRHRHHKNKPQNFDKMPQKHFNEKKMELN